MTEPVALMEVAKLLKKPLDDLYETGKSSMKTRLKRWQAANNINSLYKKISNIQKVKTIWQVEKEVNIKTFYYPSKIIVDNKRIEINKAEKVPLDTNVVIQGTVGQGKSIFLRYLCSQELRIGNKIPVFIELRKIDDQTSLKDLVYTTLNSWGFDVDDLLFDFFAKSGKFLFLFDGFDEIGSVYIQKTISQLENWSDKYENLRIIVTSRPDSGIERSAFFRVFHLAPLTKEDQEGIIGKLASNEEQKTSIIIAIKNSSNDIKGLLTTPLMITLLIIAYKTSQKIPEELSEFYDELFQTLLVRHDKTKPGFTRERKCEVNERRLQEIFEAFCFFSSKYGYTNFSHREIFKVSSDAVQTTDAQCDPALFIHDIVKLSCLIVEEGLDYHFVHKSVREFYCANFIKNRNAEFAKKFYELMLKGNWHQWNQELVFLSQIDKYKFFIFFLKPHIEEIMEKYRIEKEKEKEKIEKAALLEIFDNSDFKVVLRDKTLAPYVIKFSGNNTGNFPGTYDPYELATKLIFRFSENLQRDFTTIIDSQKEEILRVSETSTEFEECIEMEGLKFIQICKLEDDLFQNCLEGVITLKRVYLDINSYIEKEEKKIKILDL